MRRKPPTNFFLPTCLTVFLIFGYLLALKISVPFTNEAAIKELFNSNTYGHGFTDRISIFSMGIMPYVSAYLLVEICSLIIPALKEFRKNGPSGRRKLKIIALIGTFFISILQGTGLVNGLTKLTSPTDAHLFTIGNNFEFALTVAILVGGVYLLILICELISTYGIGNGISLILLTGVCTGYYNHFRHTMPLYNQLGIHIIFPSLLVLFVLTMASIFLLTTRIPIDIRHRLKPEMMDVFHFNGCPSAAVAIVYASSIVMIPVTISNFSGRNYDWVRQFNPGSFSYELVNIVLIFAFSYLFAWAFLHPKKRVERLRKSGWEFSFNKLTPQHELLKRLWVYNLPWTLFLWLLTFVPHILITSFSVPFYIGGATILIAVAVILDILDRFRFGMTIRQKPVKIAQFNDVYDATMVKNFLSAEKISCHVQGYYHRHLSYFFGPYIEMVLFVPESNKAHAMELIDQYFDGFGALIKKIQISKPDRQLKHKGIS